jgi:hypothetical protein
MDRWRGKAAKIADHHDAPRFVGLARRELDIEVEQFRSLLQLGL